MTRPMRFLACVIACAALAACSSVQLPSKKIDYKSAAKLPSLEVPPDLIRPGTDDRFAVPEIGSRGTATFSEYARDRQARPLTAGSSAVLPPQDTARIERAGTQRWLVVKGEPDQLWPAVKSFWQEVGFIVNMEVPEAGVMETDWAENRARVPDGFIRNTLGRFLDAVYSTSERDKFRTRLERGAEPGTTEVYISHRGMEEVYTSMAQDQTKWQPRPPNPEMEAEMLGRLMSRLGIQDERVKAQLATAKSEPARAVLERGGALSLNEQFDRAWRRVGLALDRVGFTVVDRDRSQGVYYVRYIDPGLDNRSYQPRGGWLSNLRFWGSGSSARDKTEQFRVVVRDVGERAEVNVLNKEGAREQTATADRILNLLYEQLR
jgi:outer membrane protein assembly factor BamC